MAQRGSVALLVALILLAGVSFAFLVIVPMNARAAVLYVGGVGPGNYTTIQAAIDAASPGDSVYVYSGRYDENVIVDKTLSLVGQDMNSTVINGTRLSPIVRVTSDGVNITGFTVTTYQYLGNNAAIDLTAVRDCRVAYNNVSINNIGVNVAGSYDILVANNSFSINQRSIYIVNSENITITDNNFTSSSWGVDIAYSKNIDVVSNNFLLWNFAVSAGASENLRIDGNTLSSQYAAVVSLGFYIESSKAATITSNTIVDGGIFIDGALLEHWNTHAIDTSNTVNGKPVYYWKNVTGGYVPADAGQVILANTKDVVVEGHNVSRTVVGVEAGFSTGAKILNLTAFSDRENGVYLQFSVNSTISGATFSNDDWAVKLNNSDGSSVIDNSFVSNWDGLRVRSSNSCLIERNSVTTRGFGIVVEFSDGSRIANNTVDGYLQPLAAHGITVGSSNYSFVVDNYVANSDYGISIEGYSNTTSTGTVVARNVLFNNTIGVQVVFTAGNIIDSNYFTHGLYNAIALWTADGTIVVNNTLSDNGSPAQINLSSGSIIYHNNFLDSMYQASSGGGNSWDDGYPSGGNYWSNYTGADSFSGPNQDVPGSDGIGDTPVPIWGGSDEDRYPLMSRFVPGALPDLVVPPPEIYFSEVPPFALGSPVTITARIVNTGPGPSGLTTVRFHDGIPPSPQIGLDQELMPMVTEGSRMVSVTWTPLAAGMRDICIWADPENLVIEESELNNRACVAVEVVFSLQLTPVHRFVSFPTAVADDSIGSVLSSISGCYDYVRWYDPMDTASHWKSYAPGKNYNSLLRLNNTMGFWINVTSACGLVLHGATPNSTTVALHQGWNMVGFPSYNATYTVADLKADIGLVGVVVEAFDLNTAPYYLQRVSDSYSMKVGEGYWIYVPSDVTWIVHG